MADEFFQLDDDLFGPSEGKKDVINLDIQGYRAKFLEPKGFMEHKVDLNELRNQNQPEFNIVKKQAELCCLEKRYEEAIPLWEALSKCKLSPHPHQECLEALAICCLNAGQYEKAILASTQLIEDKKNLSSLIVHAKCLEAAERFSDAVLAWEQVLTFTNQNAHHWLALGECFQKRNRPGDNYFASQCCRHAQRRIRILMENTTRRALLQQKLDKMSESHMETSSSDIDGIPEDQLTEMERKYLFYRPGENSTNDENDDDIAEEDTAAGFDARNL